MNISKDKNINRQKKNSNSNQIHRLKSVKTKIRFKLTYMV